MPIHDFLWDVENGLRMVQVAAVECCEVCGTEGIVTEIVPTMTGTRRIKKCPNHPDAKLKPAMHVVPDLVSMDPKKEYGWVSSVQAGDVKDQKWAENYEANKDIVTDKGVWDLPPSDVVYIVGAGPSLKKNASALANVRNGVIVTLNAAQKLVRGDYFLAVDYKFDDVPDERCRDTVAVLPPVVPATLAHKPWKEIRWIRNGATSPTPERIGRDHPGLWRYYEGLNCTYVAMMFAVMILKAKRIVLVGIDCSFPGGEKHPDEKVPYDPTMQVTCDCNGEPVITNNMMLAQMEYLMVQAMFCMTGGIKVTNCTEGGILPQSITINCTQRMGLADAVSANNASASPACPDGDKTGTSEGRGPTNDCTPEKDG